MANIVELMDGSGIKEYPITKSEAVYISNNETVDDRLPLLAPLASPNLTGVPTAPTAPINTFTTQIATTEFVKMSVAAKVSDLASVTIEAVQNLINSTPKVDIDVDLDLGSSTLTIPSDREIFSSNDSVITGSTRIFQLLGSHTDTGITLTFVTSTTATASGALENDKKYMIKGNQLCICDTTLGYPNYMGGGTENDAECYPVIYTALTANGTDVITSTATYGVFNTGAVHTYDAIQNVYIHDLTIISSGNASANTNAPIYCYCCENCKFENVNVTIDYGNCFTLALCNNVVIYGCSATANNLTLVYHYDDNVYRLSGCYGCLIENSKGRGSQPFDITYDGVNTCASAFCVIRNCESYACYTGLTTHPGTWSCTIDGLVVRNISGNAPDGISVRGSMHIIKNCKLYGTYEAGTYGMGSIEGCSCHTFINNYIYSYQYAYRIHEAANRPYTAIGTPFFVFRGNNIVNCASVVLLNSTNDNTTALSYYADISDNTIRGDGSWSSTPKYFICISGDGTSTRQMFAATGNNVLNKTFDVFLYNGAANTTFKRSVFDVFVIYSTSMDNSYRGTCSEIFLSMKKGVVGSVTTSGTKIPAITEVNT